MWTRPRGLLVFCAVLFLTCAAPAAAQQREVGIGLSNLGDYGGWGVHADLASPFRELDNGNPLFWVADISYHRNSVGLDLIDLSTLLLQGGVRVSGAAGERARWYGHGLAGIARGTASNELTDALCDELDLDCDESETSFVFTPGAGLNYSLNERTSIFGQLDIPIGEGGSTTRFTIGLRFRP